MISVGFKTDKGALRSGNEDSLFVMPAQQIYIVADGVGGHNSGELASRMAVGYIAQYVAMHPISEVTSKIELRRYFLDCFQGANELIYHKSLEEEGNTGMATTTVLCYLDAGDCYIVNVGDSRAYLIREGVMRQLPDDHTLVQDMLRSGLLTKDEALTHPDRNMITKAIGGESAIEPDFYRFETCPGDVILLCTDGLYGEVSADKILRLASDYDSMHDLAKRLVEEANEAGGKDNISVVCIRIGG